MPADRRILRWELCLALLLLWWVGRACPDSIQNSFGHNRNFFDDRHTGRQDCPRTQQQLGRNTTNNKLNIKKVRLEDWTVILDHPGKLWRLALLKTRQLHDLQRPIVCHFKSVYWQYVPVSPKRVKWSHSIDREKEACSWKYSHT